MFPALGYQEASKSTLSILAFSLFYLFQPIQHEVAAFAFALLFAGAFAAPNPAAKLEARINCAQCIAVYSASSCTAPGAVEKECGSLASELYTHRLWDMS